MDFNINIKKLKKSQRHRLYKFLKNNKSFSIGVATVSLIFFVLIFYVLFEIRNILSIMIVIILAITYRFIFLMIYSVYNKWALQVVRNNKENLKYNLLDILSITISIIFSEIIGYIFFIIPGIYQTYNFILKYYVYFDYYKYGKPFVLKETHRILSGVRWQFFKLISSFLPAFFICILTFGIGFVYFMPYFSLCTAEFYEKVKIKNILD